MSQASKIEWTDATWNSIRGCSRVSQGCVNCYAERVAARFSGPGQPYEGLAVMKPDGPHWTGKVRLVEELLDWPLRRRKPLRIFVNSMSDLFHESLSDDDILRVFDAMMRALRTTPHIFQLLTKRPARILDFCRKIAPMHETPNIWLGVSVEDQATANERVPLLLGTPAAVRWISAEPLLGPIDLDSETADGLHALGCGYEGGWRACPDVGKGKCSGLDWVVVGGESGPGARPMDIAWVRSLRDQCQAAQIPVFMKQLGRYPEAHKPEPLPFERLYEDPHGRKPLDLWVLDTAGDRKGGTMAYWPEDLRVREFPRQEVPA